MSIQNWISSASLLEVLRGIFHCKLPLGVGGVWDYGSHEPKECISSNAQNGSWLPFTAFGWDGSILTLFPSSLRPLHCPLALVLPLVLCCAFSPIPAVFTCSLLGSHYLSPSWEMLGWELAAHLPANSGQVQSPDFALHCLEAAPLYKQSQVQSTENCCCLNSQLIGTSPFVESEARTFSLLQGPMQWA